MATFDDLIAAADPGELLVTVDRLVAARDWDGLVQLSDMCDHAVEVGRQLWPISMHIDYRLALEAPGPYAASVCEPGAARFALGPLTEVVATRHTWQELDEWLVHAATRTTVVQERVIRGEDLRDVDAGHDLPPVRLDFEAAYALPSYDDRRAAFPEPRGRTAPMPGLRLLARPPAGAILADDDACKALTQAVDVWTSQSRGTVRTVRVDGGAERAIAALSERASLRSLGPHEGMALLQWAGASGGAHGRRPGGAAGRFSAWWAASAICGLEWPDDADLTFALDLAAAIGELHWYTFATPVDQPGWSLRLAVADPLDGLAWAVDASDTRDDPEDREDPEDRDD